MIKLPVVEYSDIDDNCPAFVSFDSGTIYVNSPYFSNLSKEIQSFILHHEQGHYVLNTDNDYLADRYAFDQVIGNVSTLSIYDAISLLDTSKAMAAKRFSQIYMMILNYKYQQTGNLKYMNEIDSFLKRIKKMSNNNLTLTTGGISFFMPDNDQEAGPYLMGNVQFSPDYEKEDQASSSEISEETANLAFPYLQERIIEPVTRYIDEAKEELKAIDESGIIDHESLQPQSFITEKVFSNSSTEYSETWIEKNIWYVLIVVVLLLIIIRK